jgi:probable F420-dependent oxidoreductase
MKPFRFGVNVGPARSRAQWAEKARLIEALGYDVLTVADHLSDLFAPMPALLAAAAATTTLRLGTNVLNNDLRHPVMLAREAATIDLLTDGRLMLGLGAGYMRSEYDEAGLVFDRGGIRVERLAESVRIIKALMSGEPCTFAGQHYHVSGHKIYPLPVQRPHPPIMVSGNGQQLLTLAAQEADIVGLSGITFRRGGTAPDLSGWNAAGAEERIGLIRRIAGERVTGLEINILVQRVVTLDDRHRAAEELARNWNRPDAREILESPHVLIGPIERIVDDLLARRERWGISYITIFETDLHAFAPVVARLAGR